MAANSIQGPRPKSGSKRPGQELERPQLAHSATHHVQQHASAMQQPEPVPLKYVVQEAVKRWFDDTLQEAQRGDVKQQALLGQMYAEGYGCKKDPKLAKEWSDKAQQRGYRMSGVYCEL